MDSYSQIYGSLNAFVTRGSLIRNLDFHECFYEQIDHLTLLLHTRGNLDTFVSLALRIVRSGNLRRLRIRALGSYHRRNSEVPEPRPTIFY